MQSHPVAGVGCGWDRVGGSGDSCGASFPQLPWQRSSDEVLRVVSGNTL